MKNDVVYVLGISKADRMDFATIWTFDINNHLFQQIMTGDPIDRTAKNYNVEVRLRAIKFSYWHRE